MDETKGNSSNKLRILVIENDPQWRQDHLQNLQNWGYDAYAAEAPGNTPDEFRALWNDAIAKAHSHRCHVALVDMRLKSDQNKADRSGLELVPWLAPAVSIIVSGHGDKNTVREALKSSLEVPQRAYDFVGKEDGPDALKQVIEETLNRFWSHESVVQTDWSLPDLKNSQAVVQRFFPEDPCVPSEEADDVLRRLLPKATRKITLTDLNKSTGTPTLMLRPRSLVIKALTDNNKRPVVVKLMRQERVEKEMQGYECIKDQLTAARFAYRPSDPVKLWDIGGVTYLLVGGNASFELFSEFYKAHEAQEIASVLSSLKELWMPLYQESHSETISLAEAYGKVWGTEWYAELIGLKEELEPTNYPEIYNKLQLQDPIAWLDRKKEQSLLGSTKIAITHGDLQGDNIFVDENRHVWVIDYERTGPGPILQDWVELEIDIMTRLANDEIMDVDQFFRHVCDTYKPTKLQVDYKNLPKVLSVVCEIRNVASDSSGIGDAREYYWGLLLNTLFRLAILLKQERYRKIEVQTLSEKESVSAANDNAIGISRCLLLAATLCHRLDNWDKPWPPAEWESVLSDSKPNEFNALATKPSTGFRYALLIGVGDTPMDPLFSLPLTVTDAQAMQSVLADPSHCAYPLGNVRLLSNTTATLADIRIGLSGLPIKRLKIPTRPLSSIFLGMAGI